MNSNQSNDTANISNVVGIVKLADNFDLQNLYIQLENTLYEPEQFSGLTYRNEKPPGTVILFRTGKAICTGAKNKQIIHRIVADLVAKLKFLEISVYDNYQIQIKNMVLTKDLDRPINLAKVSLSFGLQNVDYEPEDFPGLIYKIEDPKVTFILFESGKVICTGSDSYEASEKAYKLLEKKLKYYDII